MVSPCFRLWTMKAPPRVIVFVWLVLRGSVLIKDNLCKLRKTVVNACPMILVGDKTVDHLFLNC